MDALNGNATDLTQFNATLMELRRDLCLLSFAFFRFVFSSAASQVEAYYACCSLSRNSTSGHPMTPALGVNLFPQRC